VAIADLRWRVEEACLNGWPALREILFDGWLMRFSAGHTRRANSINPIASGTRQLRDKIAYCEGLYAMASLPTIFRMTTLAETKLDLALDEAGYEAVEDMSRVLHLDLAGRGEPASAGVTIEPMPSRDWLDAHARFIGSSDAARRHQQMILASLSIPAIFGALRDADGELAAVAFGAVHDRIVCINLVATDPRHRRRGFARRVIAAILGRARKSASAERACLAVVATNAPAIALYRSIGFTTELNHYHYRRKNQVRSLLNANSLPP
jgi:ribosomal protein S18 acetylase RimI-like enzyme